MLDGRTAGDQQPEARPSDRHGARQHGALAAPRQLGASSLGNAYVILNVPDFTLKVMQNGAQVWNTRVVTEPRLPRRCDGNDEVITVNPT